MERRAHAQASYGTTEETSEDEHILGAGGCVARVDDEEKIEGCEDCREGAEEVGVDVYRFVVEMRKGEDGVEG